MNLRHLRYFVEIVDQGSMIKASETLYVAQPALSQHMRNLEQELGVKLFNRSVKGVAPTEAGFELLQRARSILAQIEEASRVVREGSPEPQGSVALGLPPSVSAMLCVPLIARMQRELPHVALRVVEGTSGYVLNWLQSGQIDLGVLYEIQRASGIVAQELFHERLYLISPAGSAARPDTIKFQNLGALDLILPGRHHGLRDMMDRLAREQGVALNVRVEIDALSQMKALVKHGVGNTILSYAAVQEEIGRGELRAIEIVEPRVERTMYIAQSNTRPPSNAIRATINRLEECVQERVDLREIGSPTAVHI